MTNKNRLAKLEARSTPPGEMVVIWEDMDNPGNFYTTSQPGNGKRLTEKAIKALEEDPNIILFEVKYSDKWGTRQLEPG